MDKHLQIATNAEFLDFLRQHINRTNRAWAHTSRESIEAFGNLISKMDESKMIMGIWWKHISVELDAIKADAEKIKSLLLPTGLWLPPSASMRLLRGLKDIAEQEDAESEDIKQFFIEHYEKGEWHELQIMVSSWENNPYFSARMYIIEDALEAHINGKYTLVIPTLLTQIEGIFSDITHQPAGKPVKLIKDAVNDEHGEFLKEASKDLLIDFVISPIGYGGGIKNFDFTSQKYSSLLQAKGIPEDQCLNRHAILHGVHINYASKENSLRLFLILDAAYHMKEEEWDEKLKWILGR